MKLSGTKSFQTITVQPQQEGWEQKSFPFLTTGYFFCASLCSLTTSLGCIQHVSQRVTRPGCSAVSPASPVDVQTWRWQCAYFCLHKVMAPSPPFFPPSWEVRKMRTAYKLSWNTKVNQSNPLWITLKVVLCPKKQKEFHCLPHSETLPSAKWHD